MAWRRFFYSWPYSQPARRAGSQAGKWIAGRHTQQPLVQPRPRVAHLVCGDGGGANGDAEQGVAGECGLLVTDVPGPGGGAVGVGQGGGGGGRGDGGGVGAATEEPTATSADGGCVHDGGGVSGKEDMVLVLVVRVGSGMEAGAGSLGEGELLGNGSCKRAR